MIKVGAALAKLSQMIKVGAVVGACLRNDQNWGLSRGLSHGGSRIVWLPKKRGKREEKGEEKKEEKKKGREREKREREGKSCRCVGVLHEVRLLKSKSSSCKMRSRNVFF